MTFKDIIYSITGLGTLLVAMLMGIAIVVFLWGILKYFTSFDNAEKRTESIKFMIAGIIGIAVMAAMWGLVALMGSIFGFDFNGIPQF